MRKLVLAVFAVAALAVPVTASADDVADGADCRAGNAEPVNVPVANGNGDRGHACVNAGGVTVAYIGGEVQAEEEGNPDAGGACGAIIVANTTVTGTDDWDNAGEDGEEGTEDDQHCD